MAAPPDRHRVLWLAKGLGRGGAERLIVDAAGMLDRERYEVEAAYLLPRKDALVPDLEAEGIPVHCLGQSSAYDLRWVARLRRLVAARHYRLVHTHAPVPAVAARTVLADPRPRLVHTEHNVWERYRWPTYWTNARTYARNDHVIAVSEAVARSVPARRVRRRDGTNTTVEVVLHGIRLGGGSESGSTAEEARDMLGLPRDVPVVGIVANLTPKKDLSTLLRAFAVLRADCPDARLVIVGAGVLDAALRGEADQLNLGAAVLWAGSRPDVRALLPAFDVFALTSRFEGLPIAMLEGMAAGLPVVVTPVGGIGEVVTDGREGFFAPVGDAGAVASCLAKILDDPVLRSRLGAAAFARSQDFDLARAVRRTEQIYAEVLGS